MTNFSDSPKTQYCEELDKFIENTDKYLEETCSYLNWDIHNIENKHSYITCPFNDAHRIPEKTIENHLKKCEWNTLGYTKNCMPLSESTVPSDNPSTIKFDIQLQHSILQAAKQKDSSLHISVDEKLIPQTSDRFISDFTSDERKAMYEYVISNTVAPDIGKDITDINKPDKTNKQNLPILELLAQERNLKRRRTKHKGIHTNKKSHIELVRELVQQQMEMLKEHISKDIETSDSEHNQKSNYYNDKSKVSERHKKEIYDSISEYDTAKYNQSNLIETSQAYDYKVKLNHSKNDKSRKIIKDNRDCYNSSKHSSQFNYINSKDQYSHNSSLKYDYYDKHEYRDSVRSYDSESKKLKNDRDKDRHRKREKSKSNEKHLRCDSKEHRHKKSKKHDKKKRREHSFDRKDERKSKISSHKHSKHKSETKDD